MRLNDSVPSCARAISGGGGGVYELCEVSNQATSHSIGRKAGLLFSRESQPSRANPHTDELEN